MPVILEPRAGWHNFLDHYFSTLHRLFFNVPYDALAPIDVQLNLLPDRLRVRGSVPVSPYRLESTFLRGLAPLFPFRVCGEDPGAFDLGCEVYTHCS